VACLAVLLYFVLLWTPKRWWNTSKYIWVATLIITGTMILHYIFGIFDASLLWPLVFILAIAPGEYNRVSIILALLTLSAILIQTYTSPHSFVDILAFLGLFAGVRSRRIRKEAYRLSKLHLAELNEAHRKLQDALAELEAATVHSMRYAALEERTRLARDIHDGLGHELTSLIVQLQKLEIMLPENNEQASETVSQLLHISRQAMAEVRRAVREWSDDEMGLDLVALKGLVSQTQGRSSIQFSFVQDSDVSEWHTDTSVTLYRVLQESLTNVLRHSNAASVAVRIKEVDDLIMLTVADDGEFTESMSLTPGFGLKGIVERCRLLGGSCTFTQEKSHGLRIEVKVPIEPHPVLS